MASRTEKDLMSNYMRGTGDTFRDAIDNPEKYTTSQPNNATKPAYFTTHHTGKNKGEKIYHYKVEKPKTITKTVYKDRPVAAKPTPVAEPTGISDKLQAAYDFKKSGSNFVSNTQAERKELTDSFKQTPAL